MLFQIICAGMDLSFAVAAEPVQARLLTDQFYKITDVCADARKADPTKKMALILLKTHFCDDNSHVCLDSLRTVTDPANIFVKKNFVVYQTRFSHYAFDEKESHVDWVRYGGEEAIRKEWGKPDTNPEVGVVDLATCKYLGKRYLMDDPSSFHENFVRRYVAMRKTILKIPGVDALLGGQAAVKESLPSELVELNVTRGLGMLEINRHDALTTLNQQSTDQNLKIASVEHNFSEIHTKAEYEKSIEQDSVPDIDLLGDIPKKLPKHNGAQ